MEPISPQNKIAKSNFLEKSLPKEDVSVPQEGIPGVSTPEISLVHHTKNLYPVVRHILLIICILFSITLILLLMHQNGKSIYDNGL
jgi:hypothetical protein